MSMSVLNFEGSSYSNQGTSPVLGYGYGSWVMRCIPWDRALTNHSNRGAPLALGYGYIAGIMRCNKMLYRLKHTHTGQFSLPLLVTVKMY